MSTPEDHPIITIDASDEDIRSCHCLADEVYIWIKPNAHEVWITYDELKQMVINCEKLRAPDKGGT